MTLYNDVCRRYHLPREPAIRRLLCNTNVDLTLYGPSSSEQLEEGADGAGADAAETCETDAEEGAESEVDVEDDPCFLSMVGWKAFALCT